MNPILDQPQMIAHEHWPVGTLVQLANQELLAQADANADLYDLRWPWAGESYAQRVTVRVASLRDEAMTPLVIQLHPGAQEVVLGNEGMIVSKRLFVPFKSSDDRAVIWLLACQAEGDHLLRIEVEIEWGEPLTQRLVDGLLVAQRNPRPAQGIYAQSNAERTCVFGDPNGRPEQAQLDDPARARLVYYVLINGETEVALILTVSDVGEQMAWNDFLALRDAQQVYDQSSKAWENTLKIGRLWTPDPALNHAVQHGKLLALRSLQRLRSGYAPTDRQLAHLPTLVAALDATDPILSRNLLAHARRVAERSAGRLPIHLPVYTQVAPVDPGDQLAATNGAYLLALRQHLAHHPNADLLAEHDAALQACVTALLAAHQSPITPTDTPVKWENWASSSGWQQPADQPWGFVQPWPGIELAGAAIWQGCGLRWQAGELWVEPTWPATWGWWALLDLPVGQHKLSLLWDGVTLHTTLPVQSRLPVQHWSRLRLLQSDELDFDPRFELQSRQQGDEDGEEVRQSFRPTFL